MKFALIALIATAATNATTGDYQYCTSDIVCEEGSLCATVSQTAQTSSTVCAPWINCTGRYGIGNRRSDYSKTCKSTTPYIINEGLGRYSGWLVSYTPPVQTKKNASALGVATAVAVASSLFAMQ